MRGVSRGLSDLGLAYRKNTENKYLILIELSVDIDRIYSEFIQIYLRARRRQNACTFPGNLAVAGDPRSVADRARKINELRVRSRMVRAVNVSRTNLRPLPCSISRRFRCKFFIGSHSHVIFRQVLLIVAAW